MKKKLLLASAIFLALAIVVYAVCTLGFLDSEFLVDDATPLADPYTTSGGQSVDAVETDGSLAVSSGSLVVTAQSTPVDGDLGMRLNTDAGVYLGRATFFKIIPTTLATGIGSIANVSNFFGFVDQANVQIANGFDYGFGMNASQFVHFGWSDQTTSINFAVYTPTTTDTFYVAYIMGGGSSVTSSASTPWYSGATPASFTMGHSIYMKKGIAGSWYLVGVQHSDAQTNTTRYPFISNYNSAFKVDFWGVTNDTVRNIISPLHYQSMNGTASGQLFDDTPEVGAAYDSVKGNFTFHSGGTRVNAAGSEPDATLKWISTTNVGDDDVYVGSLISCASGSSPAGVGIVLRYKASNSDHVLLQIADGTPDNFRIFTCKSGTYTQRAIDSGISLPIGDTPGYVWGFIYDFNDSTRIYAGFVDSNGSESNPISYTYPGLFNTGETNHGIRIAAIHGSNGVNDTHFRAMGFDAEYNDSLNCYLAAPAPEAVVKGKNTVIVDGDATPSTSDSTDFGSVLVAGATRKVTYKIFNTGDAALTLSGTPKVAVAGTHSSDFTVTTQPSSPVAVGDSTSFVVEFDPSASGTRSATLSFDNDDSDENPYNWSIQGTGTAPEMNVKGNNTSIADGDATPSANDSTDFGNVVINSATRKVTFNIFNTGNVTLAISGTPRVAVGGTHAADFTVTTQPAATIAAGDSSSFVVQFDPSAPGVRSATLSISNDDADENPYNFSIQGSGQDDYDNFDSWRFNTDPTSQLRSEKHRYKP